MAEAQEVVGEIGRQDGEVALDETRRHAGGGPAILAAADHLSRGLARLEARRAIHRETPLDVATVDSRTAGAALSNLRIGSRAIKAFYRARAAAVVGFG